MKEVEIEDAVAVAQVYDGKWIKMPASLVEQVCKALVALDKDEIEEDDAEPLLTEPTGGRLDYALRQLVIRNGLGSKTTIVEYETPLYDEEKAKLETAASQAEEDAIERMEAIEDVARRIAENGVQSARVCAWPTGASAVRIEHGTHRMTLFGVDPQDFHLGMRVNLDGAPMDRWSCFKRWLLKRNWRVVDIFGRSVTVERSR